MSAKAQPIYLLTVGPVPMRKGQWLGVQNGTYWKPLAKFRNDEAAKVFLDLLSALTPEGLKVV